MRDKIFLDSNILIYCYSNTDLNKQYKARELILNENSIISTQVLNETIHILQKKYGVSWKNLEILIHDFENNFIIQPVTSKEIKNACQLANRYGFSFYDSLILAAALESNCSLLFSEDMQHKQLIEYKIKILNPFL